MGESWGVERRLKVIASGQGGVFSREQAGTAGYSPEQMRERLADGRWQRVRRGQYAEAVELGHLPAWQQEIWWHRRAIHAVVNSVRPGSVAISHQSALVLHDVAMWGVDLAEVHVTRRDERTGRRAAGVRQHAGKLTTEDLAEVDGLTVTSVTRAVVELACTSSFESAVVTVDSALHRGLVSRKESARLLDMIEFWPGSATARAAFAFGSQRSESVGESRLRVLMHDHGLPVPVLQHVVTDARGFVGRTDFYFPDHRTVVEFDGLMKYGSVETLVQEKLREDRLRALGLQVVRIVWADLSHPPAVITRIRQAFARAALG
jgi:predicted transcriptional regulator of viral defense system